jgi:hypothetical protein
MGYTIFRLHPFLQRYFKSVQQDRYSIIIIYIPYKSDNTLRKEAPTNNFIFSTTSTVRASYTIYISLLHQALHLVYGIKTEYTLLLTTADILMLIQLMNLLHFILYVPF